MEAFEEIMDVGSNDAFERRYTQNFRVIAGDFGEFVSYERDRATRDIGLHFTHSHAGGGETVSPSLAWFQLKGLRTSTLSKGSFNSSDDVPIPLHVRHLKFWHMLPDPTYLVVYLESVDLFLVCDVQKVIQRTWGDDILTLNQDTATIRIPTDCVLDGGAFYQIRLENETTAWADRFKVERQHWKLLLTHYELIYRLKTRKERAVYGRLVIRDWLTKTRIEVDYLERPRDASAPWRVVWTQWTHMGMPARWPKQFPYLGLFPTNRSGIEPDDDDDLKEFTSFVEIGQIHKLRVSQGRYVYARDEAGERVDFECNVKLNSLGVQLSSCLQTLIDADFYKVDLEKTVWLSLAGWHDRGI